MKLYKKITITLVSCSFFAALPLVANENSVTTLPLKTIMQGLLEDTQQVTKGIFLEDFDLIEKSALKIAKHPKVPKSTRQKLAQAFGPEMGKFKGFDMTVHNTAMAINAAAKIQDMNEVFSNYHKLIDGCQSCHTQFKQKASKLLNAQ